MITTRNEDWEAELAVLNQGEFAGMIKLETDLGCLRFKNLGV